MSSILKQQLANVAYAKEKLFAQGISREDQEAAFQEDMFFPKTIKCYFNNRFSAIFNCTRRNAKG